jgi:hypothetical protein
VNHSTLPRPSPEEVLLATFVFTKSPLQYFIVAWRELESVHGTAEHTKREGEEVKRFMAIASSDALTLMPFIASSWLTTATS